MVMLAAADQGQFAAKTLQDDLGCVALLPGLIGPFAGLQLAFDIDLASLGEILLRDLTKAIVEDHHPMPFGFLTRLTGLLVGPALRRGDREMHDPGSVLRLAHLGIPSEMTLFTDPAMVFSRLLMVDRRNPSSALAGSFSLSRASRSFGCQSAGSAHPDLGTMQEFGDQSS